MKPKAINLLLIVLFQYGCLSFSLVIVIVSVLVTDIVVLPWKLSVSIFARFCNLLIQGLQNLCIV